MLEFRFIEDENTLLCLFSGRMDTIISNELSIRITEELNIRKGSDDPGLIFPGTIIFDLQDVSFIASAFIRICVSTAKSVEKGSFSIQNCVPLLKKTFKIAGLDELLNVN